SERSSVELRVKWPDPDNSYHALNGGSTFQRRGHLPKASRQQYRSRDQPEYESIPEADRAPADPESHGVAARQANHPIGDKANKHRDSGVLQTSKRSGSSDLNAIEYLESGCNPQQRHGHLHHEVIRRIREDKKEPDDHSRQRLKQRGGPGHEQGRQSDRHQSRPARTLQVPSPYGLADPYGCRHPHAQRDHERKRRAL